jgi:hypothetical protein
MQFKPLHEIYWRASLVNFWSARCHVSISQLAVVNINLFVFSLRWQKVGDKHRLYTRNLRETPKASPTAAGQQCPVQQMG